MSTTPTVTAPPAPPAVAAPPSVEAARQAAVNNLAALLADLQPGMAQAQADIATLQGLLGAWPADIDTRLQPVVQILARVIQYTGMTAQGIGDALTALQTFG